MSLSFYFLTILLLLPVFIAAEEKKSLKTHQNHKRETKNEFSVKSFGWFGNEIVQIIDRFFPIAGNNDYVTGRRRRKTKFNKYVVPLIVGFLLIKSILLPIALKALAVLSGKAVVLSLMSLILAAIVGLKKVAQHSSGHGYDGSKYKRKDILDFREEFEDEEPYRYYRERRRKK